MLRLLPVALALLALPAYGQIFGKSVQGSGVPKTETRPVSKFSKIQLSGSGKLTIERTGTESLSVTADDNLLPLFTTEVKGDTLYLGVAKGKQPSGSPAYAITVSTLSGISTNGSSTIEASKLDSDTLSVRVSGSSKGRLAGRADTLAITISGSGKLDASELKAKRAEVSVSGSGNVTVNASDALNARISGSGTVFYLGKPSLTSRISGSGSINSK